MDERAGIMDGVVFGVLTWHCRVDELRLACSRWCQDKGRPPWIGSRCSRLRIQFYTVPFPSDCRCRSWVGCWPVDSGRSRGRGRRWKQKRDPVSSPSVASSSSLWPRGTSAHRPPRKHCRSGNVETALAASSLRAANTQTDMWYRTHCIRPIYSRPNGEVATVAVCSCPLHFLSESNRCCVSILLL